MKSARGQYCFIIVALVCALALTTTIAQAVNPLPSWSDGPAKQAIVAFVRATTDRTSPQYVPPAERIAAFDQDGTLWVEQPMYAQVMFCLERRAGAGGKETGTQERRAV